MILLVLVLMFFGGLFGIVVFLGWVVSQAAQAQKYRTGQAQIAAAAYSNVGAGNSWVISYKMNGKVREMIMPGNTEAEALKEFMLKGGNPRGITGTRRG